MQVSVEEMLKDDSNTSEREKPSFFTLKKDGEYAIVRFLHTDINDFEVLDVHRVPMGNYSRAVNCLKDGVNDSCPLCRENKFDETTKKYNYPIQRRIYIHMLKYDNPDQCTEQVWERSKDYIKKLNQLAQDYGPLYNRLYKIIRHGGENVRETTYDILPLDKDRYDPMGYKFDMNQLKYQKAIGGAVIDVNSEQMENYLKTGKFFNKDINVVPRPTEEPPTNFKSEFVMTTPVTQVQNVQPQAVIRENVQPQAVVRENVQPNSYYENSIPTQVKSYQEQPLNINSENINSSYSSNSYNTQGLPEGFSFDAPRRRF